MSDVFTTAGECLEIFRRGVERPGDRTWCPLTLWLLFITLRYLCSLVFLSFASAAWKQNTVVCFVATSDPWDIRHVFMVFLVWTLKNQMFLWQCLIPPPPSLRSAKFALEEGKRSPPTQTAGERSCLFPRSSVGCVWISSANTRGCLVYVCGARSLDSVVFQLTCCSCSLFCAVIWKMCPAWGSTVLTKQNWCLMLIQCILLHLSNKKDKKKWYNIAQNV